MRSASFWVLAFSLASLASASCAAKIGGAAMPRAIRTMAVHWMSALTLLVFIFRFSLRTVYRQFSRGFPFPVAHLSAEHLDLEQQAIGVDALAQRRKFVAGEFGGS